MFFLIIFLSFLWLLGQLLAYRVYKTWRHHILLGFIVYFAIFNISSLPFTLLGLSWVSYFYSQLIGHILAILVIVYLYFYRYGYYKNWEVTKVIEFWRQYWPYFVVLLIYIAFSWFNTSTIFWTNHTGAVWDDYFYSAKALKSIDAEHLFQQHFVYRNQVVPLQEKFVVWELFWSFMGSIFHIHTMTLAHKYIPIIVLTMFIISFDEVLRLITVKKQHKYYVFGLLMFVLFSYIQSELVKTLYMTWYGNVVLATTLLPLFLTILVKSLTDKLYLFILTLLPITFIGFSNGSVVFVSILYMLGGLIWLRYKQYKMRGSTLGYLLLTFLSVILLTFFSYMITRHFTMFHHIIETPALETEKDIFTYVFNIRLPIILSAVTYFIIRLIKQKTKLHEMIIIGVPFVILLLGMLPLINNILYNTLSFSFRRLLEVVCVFMMVYLWIVILNELYQQTKWQYIVIGLMIIMYFYAKTTRIYILEFSHIFSSTAITQPYKVHPLTYQLAEKLDRLSQGKPITVAFFSELSEKKQHFNRIFPTKGAKGEQDFHYDFGDAVVGINKYVYLYNFEEGELSISQLRKDKVSYMVTDNQFLVTIICQEYRGIIVDKLEDATLNRPIYIIKFND